MLGKDEKKCGDGDNHHHDRAGSQRCDFDHYRIETGGMVGAHPPYHRFIECLGAACFHVFRELDENGRSNRGYD